MIEPRAAADRIEYLAAEIAPEIRKGLRTALRILRDGDAPEAILSLSRLVEGDSGLLGRVATAADYPIRESLFEKQIDEVARKGHLPAEIAMDLHWLRVRINKARHNSEKAELTLGDAETALDRVLRVVEWFYRESPAGAKLETIYAGWNLFRLRLREYAARIQQWPRPRSLEQFSLELSARWGFERSPLSELLRDRHRLVLVGSPGGGKTVFLLRSFRAMCSALMEALHDGEPGVVPAVPVYAELAQWRPGNTLVGTRVRFIFDFLVFFPLLMGCATLIESLTGAVFHRLAPRPPLSPRDPDRILLEAFARVAGVELDPRCPPVWMQWAEIVTVWILVVALVGFPFVYGWLSGRSLFDTGFLVEALQRLPVNVYWDVPV